MNTLLGTLRQTRVKLARRGAEVAGATRDRGLEALQKVQNGALDWRRTLQARRTTLDGRRAGRGFFAFAGVQARVLDEVDRVLGSVTERVRAEMTRLQRLELPEPARAGAGVEREPTQASERVAEPGAERDGATETAEHAAAERDGATETADSAAAERDGATETADSAAAERDGATETADSAAATSKSATSSKGTSRRRNAKASEPARTARAKAAKAKRPKAVRADASGTPKKAAAKNTAPKGKAKATKPSDEAVATERVGSKRLVFPIRDYDALSAKAIVAEVPRLSRAQCATVRERELTHKKRKSVLKALDARLDS